MNKRLLVCLTVAGLLPLVSFAQSSLPADVDPNGANATCLSLTSNLHYGSRGTDVFALQDLLNATGYLTATPSGFFGNATLAAVKQFQSANGVSPTGYVGTYTKAKVYEVSCKAGTGGVSTVPGGVACTADAKLCPDGSWVGRSGPNCTFSCPTSGSTGSSGGTTSPGCLAGAAFNSQTGQACPPSSCQPGSSNCISPIKPICPMYPTPICTTNTVAVSSGTDVNGCPVPPVCGNPIKPICPMYPTPICTGNTIAVVASGSDINGCPPPPLCQPTGSTGTAPSIALLSPNMGTVGSQVTIVGSGFSATGNRVKFGALGSEANPAYSLPSVDGRIVFTVPSSNYLSCWNTKPACLAPALLTQPGVYQVSVITANGTSNEVPFAVTVGGMVYPGTQTSVTAGAVPGSF